jgi:hypothetical protein
MQDSCRADTLTSSSAAPSSGPRGVKARLALYQEECRKQKEIKKYEEIEVNKLNESLKDIGRFQSPIKRSAKPKAELTPTKGKKPAALAVFQLELSPSVREEHDSSNNLSKSPYPRSGHSSFRNAAAATPKGAAKSPASKHPARPPAAAQTSQQTKDEEETAARAELSKALENLETSQSSLGGMKRSGEAKAESSSPSTFSFTSVRSRYLSAVRKLAPVDIKGQLSAMATAKDKQTYKEQRRAAIRAEQSKKAQYGTLKSAWDQYEKTAQDKPRDPGDENEQNARDQLDKIEEAIDRQWIGFTEDVVEVVQKYRDDGDNDDDAGEDSVLYWVKEGKRLKSESVARRRQKLEQRIVEEEQFWIEEAIKLRDQAKLKRSPDEGRNGSSPRGAHADTAAASVPDLEASSSALMSQSHGPMVGKSKDDYCYRSPKSLGRRVAEYTKAVSSSPSEREAAATAKEVEARVEKYAKMRTRKRATGGDDEDDDDDDDLDFWIAEAKRLQGKPKARFRNKAEEERYWLAEAKKLRDAVRNGRGPNPYGEVDEVEKAILEERIDRYNDVQTRKYAPDHDEDDDDDLDFWIQEAKRLRGDPTIKFQSMKDEEKYWRQEAIAIRESVRDGSGPNPYDDVHTVGGRVEEELESSIAFSNSVRSLGNRVAAYTKATATHAAAGNAQEIERRAQKYNQVKTRKHIPCDDDDDDDDDDLDFWIAEAKRLQGKPRTAFHSKAEEESYWIAEARKLRDAVRNGKGPNPYGEVDEVEKAILEERIEKYNEIETRKYVPDDDEDDDLGFWIQEAKRLRGDPHVKFRSRKEEDEFWRLEAIAIRESVRNGNGPNPYDDVQTVGGAKNVCPSDSATSFNNSVRSLGARVAAYEGAVRSTMPGNKVMEVDRRVRMYNEVKTRKLAPEDDDDDDDVDLDFWIAEAKRLQGTPKRKFRNKEEEDMYWVAEAKKLREAVRRGKGPNPYGDVDEAEKELLEERIERYYEITSRKYMPEEADDDDNLDFWIQEAKRLSGMKKTFPSQKEEAEYWHKEAITLRNSVRNGSGPNPYDDIRTVQIMVELDDESSAEEATSGSVGFQTKSKESSDGPSRAIDAHELGERVQRYNEIRTRKYVPEDDDEDDLDFWIQEAKRLRGDPGKRFKSRSEEGKYWKSEAIALRESVRNGTGPNPYEGIGAKSCAENDSDSESNLNSQAVELQNRVEKYNVAKARKCIPGDEDDDDDDDDFAFWIQEAKRLRGDRKKVFKSASEEEAYWKKEARSLRESIRNGTGPNPYDGIVIRRAEVIDDDDDDDRVEDDRHNSVSALSHTDAAELEQRVAKYNEVKARKYIPEDESEGDDLDFWIQEAKRLQGGSRKSFSSKDEEEAYWRKESIALRESIRNGTGPSPYAVNGESSAPGNNSYESDSSLGINSSKNQISVKAKSTYGHFKFPSHSKGIDTGVENLGSSTPEYEADESSVDGSTSDSDFESSSAIDRKKKSKKKKHKKKSKRAKKSGDADDSSSDSENSTQNLVTTEKSITKQQKSKVGDSAKTRNLAEPDSKNGESPKSLSLVKPDSRGKKAKKNSDANSALNPTEDGVTPRSSKLKAYMESMSKPSANDDAQEKEAKTEQPRNLDGSLWKNPLNRWTNRPTKKVHEIGTAITMKIATKTDCWRKTRHNFIMDNAPYNWHKVSGDFEVMVKVSGDFSTMYDKAGLMIRQDDENWVLTGLEYFNDRLNHSTSITRDYTDWSLASLPATPEKGAWFRLKRMGNSIETSYSFDTETWVVTRQGVFSDRQVLQVGLCGARPMGHCDMKVKFDYYRVKSI